MPSRIPQREFIGRWTPKVVPQFSEFVNKRFQKQQEAAKATRVPSGLISGGKLGQPTLWTVLDILGFGKEYDGYTLGKFQRGHDVEARAINMLTDIPMDYILSIINGDIDNPGWIPIPSSGMLEGEVYLQMPAGYRGGIGMIDMAQRTPSGTIIYHEIKSSTKMAYDKVAATGASAAAARKRGEVPTPDPYDHHQLQLAFYCLGDGVTTAFVHYFNADDYRLISFSINPEDYKEEIDKEIDDVQQAFIMKQLPTFEALQDFHKLKNYQSYGDEWNKLSSEELLYKLESEYPEAYSTFMSKTLPTERNE